MKQPTLSILTAAVVLTPLTALAQRIQSKIGTADESSSIPVDYLSPQINHNAYGIPLKHSAKLDRQTEKSQ